MNITALHGQCFVFGAVSYVAMQTHLICVYCCTNIIYTHCCVQHFYRRTVHVTVNIIAHDYYCHASTFLGCN